MTDHRKEYLGELVGTFMLVFIGCASVAATILFNTFGSLLEVALMWGIGVTLAIFAVRSFCPAHLNPAVSLAMCVHGRLSWRKFAPYALAQVTGAFLAGGTLYLLFGSAIAQYEVSHEIVRGSEASRSVAAMFGEYFPNPGYADKVRVGWWHAMLLEALGTFLLVFVIFRLIEIKRDIHNFIPVIIGFTVMMIICVLAPFTQAGLNPARDFGPRMVAWIAGWGDAAFPSAPFGFLTVYVLGPLLGGVAALVPTKLLNR